MAALNVTLSGSVGVDTHCGYPAYKDRLPQLAGVINDVGFGVIRDDNPNAAKIWRDLGFKGRVITVVGNAAGAQAAVAAGTDYIDPINEIATSGDALTASLKNLGAIYQAVAGRVPILATSIANPSAANVKAVGVQAGARRANVHCYRGNLPVDKWRARQKTFIDNAQTQAPFLPTIIGETGWHDYQVPGKPADYAGPENSNHVMTPDPVAGEQAIPDLLAFFGMGAETVIYYELIDQWRFRPIDGKADHEGRFGLLRDDLSYKPALVAIKAFLAQFGGSTLTSALTSAAGQLAVNQDQANKMMELQRSNAAKDQTITTLQSQITQAYSLINQAAALIGGSVTNAPGA